MKKILLLLFATIFFMGMPYVRDGHAAFTLDDEKKLGKEIYDKLEKGQALLQNERIVDYINRIGNKILTNSDKQPFDFRFSVIRSSAINAFATPGGYVYVNRGLINLVENESELASVLAHEIAHVNSRHIADIIEKSKKVNIASLAAIVGAALLGGGGDLSAALIGFSMAGATAMNLKYSREHEEEADRLGMLYLVKTGYNPKSMLDFMKIMRRYEFYSNNIPSYFLTHPGTEERIRYLDASIQTIYTERGKVSIIGNFKRIQTILLIIGSKDTEGNLKHFQEGLNKNPNDVDDLYGLALTEERLGRTKDALEHFHKALALAPGDPDILSDTGITYFKVGQTDEAMKYLEEAIKHESSDPETLLFLGKAYEAKGDLPNAIATLKKLENKRIDDDDFYYTLAMMYGKAQNQLDSHYNFGLYFKKKRKIDSAIFHFKAALQLSPPGSDRAKDIEKEISSLKKKDAPPPGVRNGRKK